MAAMTGPVVLFWNMLVLLTHYTAATRNCTAEQASQCNKTNCGDCLEKHWKLISENVNSSACFPSLCSCSVNNNAQIIARCSSDSLKVQKAIAYPEKVIILDLSDSGATIVSNNVFLGFTNLINLSLARNKIRFIEERGFNGLGKLQNLDLSLNDIILWEGNIANQLPSLQMIDITGNHRWKPTKQVLELPVLQGIRGITWSESCQNCTLMKNFSSDLVKRSKGSYVEHGGWCRGLKFSFGKHATEFALHNFSSPCLSKKTKCYDSEVKITKVHRCWKTDNDVLNLIYIFGPLEIILNGIVVALTLSASCLRNNVTMKFIANLAFSDVLIGLYGILIAVTRRVFSYPEFESNILPYFCFLFGFIWVLGAFMTTVTSVLLTYERYVVIVYGMVPNKRINARKAFIYLVASWVLATAVAILPVAGIGSYTTNTFCLPIQPSRKVTSIFVYSVGITLLGVVLYLSTIPLYTQIFFYARKSGSQIGIKRDKVLAKRIAILVFSNMVFFFFPTITGLLWQLTPAFKNLNVITREILVGPLPVVFYTVNSFINPLLYAYRNDRFRQVFIRKLTQRQTPSSSVGQASRASNKFSTTNKFVSLEQLQN